MSLILLILLAFSLLSASGGIRAMVGSLSAGELGLVTFVGMAAGWLAAKTRLKGWKSALLLGGGGLVYLVLTIGRAGTPVWEIITAAAGMAHKFSSCTIYPALKPILPCPVADFTPLAAGWKDLGGTLATLASRLNGWVNGVNAGTRIVDPMVVPLLWGAVFWAAAAWAAWWVFRRHAVLPGMLPALAVLAYNVYYTNSVGGVGWLVRAAGGMLLLQAASAYQRSDRRWEARHLDRVTIEPALGFTVLVLAGSLMLAGQFMPNISIRDISERIQKLFQPSSDNPLAESLGLRQTPVKVKNAQPGNGPVGISALHAVGAGPHLTQDLVMTIEVQDYVPLPPDVERYTSYAVEETYFYWRAQTYDAYNGRAWAASANQSLEYAANAPYYPNLEVLPENYSEVVQHVERAVKTGGILFAAGDVLTSDQPSTGEWRASSDLVDAQTEASAYTATSRRQKVTVTQLRQAGNDYPDYISRRYLALPDTLPQRVRDLALDLTAKYNNGYDRAIAIQGYLRQFPYSLEVPAPPTGREVTDFFLFDLQKGYCDYFATSMAVLSRAAGLPSRLVTGYSRGSYDYGNHRFVVVAANAHAWVELYFPGIGWVEFEPTSSQPAIYRPGGGHIDITVVPSTPPPPGAGIGGINLKDIRHPLILLAVVLAAALGLFMLNLPLETWLLSLQPAGKALSRIYQRLYRKGRRFGIGPDPSRTPQEFSLLLHAKLEGSERDEKGRMLSMLVMRDVDLLAEIYNRQLFSQAPPTTMESRQAIRAWARLRRGLGRLRPM